MNAWEIPAPPEEGGTARDEEDWSRRRAEQRTARRAEEAALRRELGLESAFGFHIVDAIEDAAVDAVRRVAPALIGSIVPVGREGEYPCLEGRRYTGCLGLACPLERCWTGGPTISRAHALERRARVSTALYLPGAPCHGCAAVVEAPEEKAAHPPPASLAPPANARAMAARRAGMSASGAPGWAGGAAPASSCVSARTAQAEAASPCADERRTKSAGLGDGVVAGSGEGGAATLGHGGAVTTGHGGVAESGDEGVAEATRRVDCSRGLWAHPISVSAFVSKRIHMLYEAEPALCPGFAARSRPHPAVAAHLERRREQARRQRAAQRERER